MFVKTIFDILKERRSKPLNERQVIALESITDILEDIFFKLKDINSKTLKKVIFEIKMITF